MASVENASGQDVTIAGLTCDSRRVAPGFLFAAIPGSTADGRHFIADAIGRGAAAVLAPEGTDVAGVPLILDANPRRRYAKMAAAFYERQPSRVVAVTGTSGKTSIVTFLSQIWSAAGYAAASLGTLGLDARDASGTSLAVADDKPLTTPDAADLHRQLMELADAGVDRLAMEASSHGLDQYRLDGVRVAAAVFTNLSRDHLDYHETEAAYLDAKLRLFRDILIDGGAAVVNADQPFRDTIIAACRGRNLPVMTYGVDGETTRLIDLTATAHGQRLRIEIDGRRHDVDLNLVGAFQASNALAAATAAMATGIDAGTVIAALVDLKGAPGRMQLAGRHANGAAVYVDYSHKPDALRNALTALRPHTAGRLHVVFGCGGDRDAGKRPEMGAIAIEAADHVIVTDDNPRTENPTDIRRAIMAAAPSAVEIGDRAEAIHAAIEGLDAGDVLLVAGKGHERGQIIGDEIRPFDDVAVVADFLKDLTG